MTNLLNSICLFTILLFTNAVTAESLPKQDSARKITDEVAVGRPSLCQNEAASEAELSVFRTSARDPQKLLRELYEESKVLAFGESNHQYYQSLDYLYGLIEEVGLDPRIRFVAVEWSSELRSLFASRSTKVQNLHDTEPAEYTSFTYRPYFELRLFPLIRRINQKRDPQNPLIVVPIDGYPEHGAASWNRENATKQAFKKSVMDLLRSEEKALVFYHSAHLMKGLTAMMPVLTSSGRLVQRQTSTGWMDQLIQDWPALRQDIKIVIFDETDLNHAPNGTLALAKRLAVANSLQSYGTRLQPFHSVKLEHGLSVFCSGLTLLTKFYGIESDSSLDQMADALIWFPTATDKNIRDLTIR